MCTQNSFTSSFLKLSSLFVLLYIPACLEYDACSFFVYSFYLFFLSNSPMFHVVPCNFCLKQFYEAHPLHIFYLILTDVDHASGFLKINICISVQCQSVTITDFMFYCGFFLCIFLCHLAMDECYVLVKIFMYIDKDICLILICGFIMEERVIL